MAATVNPSGPTSVPGGGLRIENFGTASEASTGTSEAGRSVVDLSRPISRVRAETLPSIHEVSKISRESVEAAAEKIQSFVSSMKRDLNIYVDNSTGRSVIRVVDPESSQVIRQIPPEESIRLAQTVDFLSSLLVHQRA